MTGKFSEQLVLDLSRRPAMGREDFFVAPSNSAAVAWIDKWPEWSSPALVVYGPPASGKTHLLSVWREQSGARIIDPQTVVLEDLAATDCRAVAVDNAQNFAGDALAEQALFHLYNLMRERDGHLMLLAEKPVAQWGIVLPDLASRLKAAASAPLHLPDDALLSAVMVKLFSDRQLRVGQDVVEYLLPRFDRSLASVRQMVEAIDKAALTQKKPVTVPFVRQVLQSLQKKLL